MSSVERSGRRPTENRVRPDLRLVGAAGKEDTVSLEFTYSALVLVHKSLQAAKTLGAGGAGCCSRHAP